MHIDDVRQALSYISRLVELAGTAHDFDKIKNIDGFHQEFTSGFKTTEWLKNHYKVNRHHLADADGVPSDVNLIDIIEMIVDCCVAGSARSGEIYPIKIDNKILQDAVQNTLSLLKSKIVVNE